MDRRSFIVGAASAVGGASLITSASARPRLHLKRDAAGLSVLDGPRPVLQYRHAPVEGPAGTDPLLTRSGYIHPVHAPNGAMVTDDFAPDHLHQRGVFFAWTKTVLHSPAGQLQPDFWNLASGTARIRSASVEGETREAESQRFGAKHVWEARRGDAWEAVLAESWTVEIRSPEFTDPGDPAAAYVFDITSRQTPAVPLELSQYRYGGMAVRGARQWRDAKSGVTFRTSEGNERVAADTSRARWVDMSGTLNDQEAGIALLEHPSNLGAPNPLRVHPDMPYFVFAIPQAGPITLAAGKEHVFRYRVVAHNGRTNPELLDRLWKQFAV